MSAGRVRVALWPSSYNSLSNATYLHLSLDFPTWKVGVEGGAKGSGQVSVASTFPPGP